LIANSSNHRGWGTTGSEQLDPTQPQDWKETFDMALDIHPEHPMAQACPQLYGPNQYGELEGFAQQMNQHYGLLMVVAKRLLKAMAIALKQPDDFFTQYFDDHISVLRLLHYPPRPEHSETNAQTKAAGAHTDYGCITLLAQDHIGGLEVCNAQDEWIAAPPIKDSIVVNIGDLMQRWTNDQYRSTAHRVASPPSDTHRYSMPFFVEPRYDTQVSCIKSCLAPGETPKYHMVTSGDWIMSRFDATYAYRTENP
ncbi:MAG: 2OG-Fe(II) oxygenase, partial [Bermanella sp.]